MQQKDRDRLLVLLTMIGCLVLAFLFVKGAKLVSPWILIGVCIVIQQLYAIPKLASGYYKMYGQHLGMISRYIPVYNEMCIIPRAFAVAYIVLVIGVILCGLAACVNAEVIAKYLGMNTALHWNTGAIAFGIFLFVALSFVRGIAYIGVFRDIQYRWEEYSDMDSIRSGKLDGAIAFVEGFRYVLLFIPILRSIAITYQFNTLNRLTGFGNYEADVEDEEEWEEER